MGFARIILDTEKFPPNFQFDEATHNFPTVSEEENKEIQRRRGELPLEKWFGD